MDVSGSLVFEVVHEQVIVRSAPSRASRMLCVQRRGKTVQGEPFEIEGEHWLHLDAKSRKSVSVQEESAWMLINGRRIGLHELLRQVDASGKSNSASTARPKAALREQLSREQRVALQEACLAKYRTEEFQLALQQAWATFKCRASEQAEARAALCRKIQGPLLKKCTVESRGRENKAVRSVSPLLDVFEGHACFSTHDEPRRTEAELSAWLMWLLNPCAQIAHPRGPPPDLGASTAATLADISNTGVSSPPRRRVLDQVPSTDKSNSGGQSKGSVHLKVIAGLSGDLLCSFPAESSDIVHSLKQQISARAGIGVDEQKLICESQLMKDSATLHSILAEVGGESQANSVRRSLTITLLRADPQRVSCLRKLESGSLNLWDLESPESEDPEYALAAIRRNGLMLRFIPEALQSNLEFIMEAVQLQGEALEYASKELQATLEVVTAAVQQNGDALRHAAPFLRSERSVVLAAVEKNGIALRFAPDDLKADHEVALAAVETCGMALQHVHPDMASLHDVAITALRQDSRACKFLVPALRQDLSFFAALDALRLFEDAELRRSLLWIDEELSYDLLKQRGALFVDARDADSWKVSRVPTALSLPSNPSLDNLSDAPAYQVIKDHPSRFVIVYSNFGGPESPCAYVARQLRSRPEVQSHRVLRLIGGIHRWKVNGLDIEGASNRMASGQMPSGIYVGHYWDKMHT
mmetsp:Transcript_131050/g.252452  ORF Transcript_131050/g.252452 Transcript_131050/m.252452 type:complete len:700 (-) Transcript_131050:49-2148(-)